MNSFVNDGSFMDRFKKTAASEEEPKIKFRLNEKPRNTFSNSSPSVSGPSSHLLSSSLSAQLTEKSSKLSSQARCTKVINEKPKIFDESADVELDPKTKEVIETLARSVALIGIQAELAARERNSTNPAYWFLNDKSSEAYKYYAKMVADHQKRNETCFTTVSSSLSQDEKMVQSVDWKSQPEPSRKRKSRWDNSHNDKQTTAVVVVPTPTPLTNTFAPIYHQPSSLGFQLAQANLPIAPSVAHCTSSIYYPAADGECSFSPGFVPIAGSSTSYFDAADQQETNNDSQINLFQKQILASQLAAKALARAAREKEGKPTHEYDSDEDVDGGTWEHKKRTQEMERTKDQAQHLTKRATGGHHIGDFLPLEEREKFFIALKKSREKLSTSPSEKDKSEYQDNKLLEDNVGFKLLQKMGWSAGKGLGANEQGIVAPVNKGRAPNDMQGLGSESSSTSKTEDDDLFDVYRKRMMLAYRYRPNPLNNPRRPYY